MEKQLSFSHLEKELVKEFRNNVNNSEGPIDVANYFSFVVCKIFKKVFAESDIKLENNCAIFTPNEENYFKVNEELLQNEKFNEVWNNSDLPDLLKKFAETAYHKYLHHNKHLEKTNKKIRR